MSALLPFDDEMSRRIEATYSTSDIVEQRHVILTTLALTPGEHVLDIGSGPGLLACDLAAAVGPAGSVAGIDPSESMLMVARRRPRSPGSAAVDFRPGDAISLPFPDDSFDVVTSTQVYEYIDDVPAALAEAHRVLRPGGRLLVLDTDWDSVVWRANDEARMRRILAAWDEHLVDPYLPRRLTGLLEGAGFAVTHRAAIPLFNAGYDPNTFSAGLMGFITAFVPGHAGVTEDDAAAWAADLVSLGTDYFCSVNRYLFLAVNSTGVTDDHARMPHEGSLRSLSDRAAVSTGREDPSRPPHSAQSSNPLPDASLSRSPQLPRADTRRLARHRLSRPT